MSASRLVGAEKLEKHDRLLEVLLKHPGVAELLKEHSAP